MRGNEMVGFILVFKGLLCLLWLFLLRAQDDRGDDGRLNVLQWYILERDIVIVGHRLDNLLSFFCFSLLIKVGSR